MTRVAPVGGAAPRRDGRRRGPLRAWSRLGLRARVTAAFALGALGLSLVLSLLTYTLSSTYLIRQREMSAMRQAFVNARFVQVGLRSARTVPELLDSLETPATSESVLAYRGRWFASNPLMVSWDNLPAELRARVQAGTPARQRFRIRDAPRLAVGVPLPAADAAYFEVFSLSELERTLRVLTGSLVAAAAVTVLLGVGFGRWVSGQALRPLAEVGGAARSISQGRLDTRLEPVGDADLRVLVASFNDMADALEQRIQRDARFASDISHELRSPLTTLATAAAVLYARRDELPPAARDSVDLLCAEVDRFQRMVLDLLEISRIDAGVAELTLEDVRLAELVERAAGAVIMARRGQPPSGEASAPPVEVLANEAADLAIRADKRRLERVVANLVENAETHGGGLVGIILLRVGDRVRLLVDDAGPGVAEADRTRIFERFSRAPGARRDAGGVGLGLALAAEHVRLHGGRIWVEERPGGGARFVVELPLEAR